MKTLYEKCVGYFDPHTTLFRHDTIFQLTMARASRPAAMFADSDASNGYESTFLLGTLACLNALSMASNFLASSGSCKRISSAPTNILSKYIHLRWTVYHMSSVSLTRFRVRSQPRTYDMSMHRRKMVSSETDVFSNGATHTINSFLSSLSGGLRQCPARGAHDGGCSDYMKGERLLLISCQLTSYLVGKASHESARRHGLQVQ